MVNVAFRSYYQLLKKNNLEDRFYGDFIEKNFNEDLKLEEKKFIELQYILLTNHVLVVKPEELLKCLVKYFIMAVDLNHVCLMSLLKAVNLLSKKFPKLKWEEEISLDHLYFCLQSNQTLFTSTLN